MVPLVQAVRGMGIQGSNRLMGVFSLGTTVATAIYLWATVVSISVAQIALTLALMCWAGSLIVGKRFKSVAHPLWLPFVVFVGASLLAATTSLEVRTSWIDSKDLVLILAFLLVVNATQGGRHLEILVGGLIAMTTMLAIYGIGQATSHGIASSYRARGTMSIYMTFAAHLMLVCLLTLGLVLKDFSWPRRWYYLPALGTMLVALLLTKSRNAWIGFMFGLLLLLLQLKRWRTLLLLPILALGVVVLSPAGLRERLLSVASLSDATTLERLYMWKSGLRIIRDYPVTGVGQNVLRRVYPAYKDPRALRTNLGHLHNNPLQLAAERGLLGLVTWLGIWGAFFSQTLSLWRWRARLTDVGQALFLGSVAAVAAFLVAGLFEYNFGDAEVIMLVYAIMAFPFVLVAAARDSTVVGVPGGGIPLIASAGPVPQVGAEG